MQVSETTGQPANARGPRSGMRHPAANVTLERLLQLMKHHLEIAVIDDGMQIDARAEHFSNADSPSLEIVQLDSNVTLETRSQP
jgi:hypothetical protein